MMPAHKVVCITERNTEFREPKSFSTIVSLPALCFGGRDYSYIDILEIMLRNEGQPMTH